MRLFQLESCNNQPIDQIVARNSGQSLLRAKQNKTKKKKGGGGGGEGGGVIVKMVSMCGTENDPWR